MNKGKAEFDKSSQCLTVTLTVLTPSHRHTLTTPPQPSANEMRESESHDIASEESTNQITELESCEREPTNQIAAVQEPTPPTESQSEMTSLDESTNQIAAVQELTPPTESQSETTSSAESTNQITGDGHMTWASRGDWVAPSFSYRQDNESVVLVLHSSGVKSSTLVHHHDNRQVHRPPHTVTHSPSNTLHSHIVTHSHSTALGDICILTYIITPSHCHSFR